MWWPFKKKIEIEAESVTEGMAKFLRSISVLRCPPIRQVAKDCVCMDCPCRGTCIVEVDHSTTSKCEQAFIASCSYKVALLKGEEVDAKKEINRGQSPPANRECQWDGDIFSSGEVSTA